MTSFDLCRTRFPVIGVLHVPALPGAPANRHGLEQIAEYVLADAEALASGGVDGLLVENFGDAPFYPNRVPPHTVAQLSVIGRAVRDRHVGLPLGVNVLRNDGLSALAVASAVGAQFIRVNVYCGARVTDQGLVEGEAHEVQRRRASLAPSIHVFADVDVKHSAPLGDYDLATDVHDVVERGRADAIVVSGVGTGSATDVADVECAKDAAGGAVPVWIGSGVSVDNVASLMDHADGAIVGSVLKRDGIVSNPVDPERVRELISIVTSRREREE